MEAAVTKLAYTKRACIYIGRLRSKFFPNSFLSSFLTLNSYLASFLKAMPLIVHASPPKSPPQKRLTDMSPFKRFRGPIVKIKKEKKIMVKTMKTTIKKTMKKSNKQDEHKVYGFYKIPDFEINALRSHVIRDMRRMRKKTQVQIPKMARIRELTLLMAMTPEQARHVLRAIYDKRYKQYDPSLAHIKVDMVKKMDKASKIKTAKKATKVKGEPKVATKKQDKVKKEQVKNKKEEVKKENKIKSEPSTPRRVAKAADEALGSGYPNPFGELFQ